MARRRCSASPIMRFITALTVSAPYLAMTDSIRSRPTLLAPTCARRSRPTSIGTRDRRTHRSATSRWSWKSAHHLDRRGGHRLGEHVLGRGRERAEPHAAQVRLVADRAGPGEQLSLVEDGLVDDGVVLVQAPADPGVVAQEHVALADAGVVGPVGQGPVDGQVHRPDQHRVVEADLDLLAQLVADREVEVVGVGDDGGAGHALEGFAHLLGDRPQPVPDHLIGQRVQRVDLLLRDRVHRERGRQRRGQLPRVDRPARKRLRAGNRHAHRADSSRVMMIRFPSGSTVPLMPPGTTTVVVGTSTTAGPVIT